MADIYITMVEEPDEFKHRSRIIVHDGWQRYLAEFNSRKEFERWAKYCGITYTLHERKNCWGRCGKFEHYLTKINAIEYMNFWNLEQLPDSVKPIRLHSNGSIVTGYIKNDGEKLHIFRPNPNAKNVYKPLTLKKHIKYCKKHGGM